MTLWLSGIMAQWLNGSAAQWLNGSRASLYTRYPRLFRSSVTRFGFQLRVQILYLYFQMTDGYYWRVRNTFVEVLPARHKLHFVSIHDGQKLLADILSTAHGTRLDVVLVAPRGKLEFCYLSK